MLPDEWKGAKFVYDGVLRDFDFANRFIAEATAKGAKASIWYVHSPVEKAVGQAVGRAQKDGRTLPLTTLASGHVEAQRTMIALLHQHAGNPNVDLRVFDNSGPTTAEVPSPLQFLSNEGILCCDHDKALTRAKAAYEAVKDQLTDPIAREVFETGTYTPQGGVDGPAERRGERGLASGNYARDEAHAKLPDADGTTAGGDGTLNGNSRSAGSFGSLEADGEQRGGRGVRPGAGERSDYSQADGGRDALPGGGAASAPGSEPAGDTASGPGGNLPVAGAAVATRARAICSTNRRRRKSSRRGPIRCRCPSKAAGTKLSAAQEQTLEKAERALGQKFIPGRTGRGGG